MPLENACGESFKTFFDKRISQKVFGSWRKPLYQGNRTRLIIIIIRYLYITTTIYPLPFAGAASLPTSLPAHCPTTDALCQPCQLRRAGHYQPAHERQRGCRACQYRHCPLASRYGVAGNPTAVLCTAQIFVITHYCHGKPLKNVDGTMYRVPFAVSGVTRQTVMISL